MVHRLVALAFVPNPENKPCVNHKNEDKLDNRPQNLEWMTVAENNRYGTHPHRCGRNYHWFNNGKVNMRAEICPDGFVEGRLLK